MKQIRKGLPPKSLIEHAKQKHATYDNYPDKDELRQHLVVEQRGICCYCMDSISPDGMRMKIEHFKSQESYPQHQLEYWNLLGACLGNHLQPQRFQHCDTFKGNKELHFYPPEPARLIESLIWYKPDGTIGSDNHDLDNEINKVLNLNIPILKNNRKAALVGLTSVLSTHRKELKRPTLMRWFNEWYGTGHNDTLQPFCMVVVYWIQKRLKRA